MSRNFIEAPRKLMALLLAAVFVSPADAQSPDANPLKARVVELYSKSSEVKVTMLDRTILQGRILSVGTDSFTLQQKKTGQQTVVQYAQAREVRKSGLSRRTKAILIAAIAGGSALAVVCAAPYPIGFVCRKDPS